MRRKQRLPIIFVAVGLVFLLVIALTSLVLSIVDYGASSSGSEDSEPSLALPYQPGDFTNAGSGWISYSHDGVEALHGVDISDTVHLRRFNRRFCNRCRSNYRSGGDLYAEPGHRRVFGNSRNRHTYRYGYRLKQKKIPICQTADRDFQFVSRRYQKSTSVS